MPSQVLRGAVSEYGSLANKLSADTYDDAGSWSTLFLKTKRFQFDAATNNLHVRILGSLDGGATYPITVEAEFTVTVGTTSVKTSTDWYTNLKVQVKAASGGSQGTLSTKFGGSSF